MNPKLKRSKIPGVVPSVNNFPDSNTYVWNEADGKLYGLRIENGIRTVVLIGGGINFIGEVHARIHDLESVLDHAPANGDRKGKWLRTHPHTGIPLLSQNVSVSETPPDAIEGDLWYDLSEEMPGEIGYGTRNSAIHAGKLTQMFIDDDFFYICVRAGAAGFATWKRIWLSNTPNAPQYPEPGSRYSDVHPGTLAEISIDDDFFYICVRPGEAGAATWKRTPLNYI